MTVTRQIVDNRLYLTPTTTILDETKYTFNVPASAVKNSTNTNNTAITQVYITPALATFTDGRIKIESLYFQNQSNTEIKYLSNTTTTLKAYGYVSNLTSDPLNTRAMLAVYDSSGKIGFAIRDRLQFYR